MGVRNGPPHFQRCINQTLSRAGLLQQVAAFVDDICNGGGDHAGNLENIEKLLSALHTSNFKIGAGKIELGASFLLAFGFRLSEGAWAPDPERTAPIAKLVPPANRSQLRSFLGLAGY